MGVSTRTAMDDYNDAKQRELSAARIAQLPPDSREARLLREADELDRQGHHDLAAQNRREAASAPVRDRAKSPNFHRNAQRFKDRRAHRGGYGPGAKVSAEQELNWGGAASAPRPKAEFNPSVSTPGIALTPAEKMGAATGGTAFSKAANHMILFGRYKGQRIIDAAKTWDGLDFVCWLGFTAKVTTASFREALKTFLEDPRCAAAIEQVKARRNVRGRA